MNTVAVILNKQNEIIATLPEFIGNTVEVAGAIAADGSPVNRATYKVSRSRVNLERASKLDVCHAKKHQHRNVTFYTVA